MSATYEFPRPALTVDVVAFSVFKNTLRVLCPTRSEAPFSGVRALPGGFLHMHERLTDTLGRVVRDKTKLEFFYQEQLETFDDLDRDPRDRTLSVAYLVALNQSGTTKDHDWIPLTQAKSLAFDHAKIVNTALARLRAKLEYSDIGLYFLPETFTLTEAQSIFEVIGGGPLEKRNFRKQLINRGLVTDTGQTTAGGAHRPAKLYRMTHRNLFIWQ